MQFFPQRLCLKLYLTREVKKGGEGLGKGWGGVEPGTAEVQITFQLNLTPDKLKSKAKAKISENMSWNEIKVKAFQS